MGRRARGCVWGGCVGGWGVRWWRRACRAAGLVPPCCLAAAAVLPPPYRLASLRIGEKSQPARGKAWFCREFLEGQFWCAPECFRVLPRSPGVFGECAPAWVPAPPPSPPSQPPAAVLFSCALSQSLPMVCTALLRLKIFSGCTVAQSGHSIYFGGSQGCAQGTVNFTVSPAWLNSFCSLPLTLCECFDFVGVLYMVSRGASLS